MSAAVWGWRGSVSPTLPHSSSLAVPTLLPFPAGHAAAWGSTGKPDGCQGGDGGFCVSCCPWRKQEIPGRLSPVHVRVALLSLAVAFFPGVGVPGFGVSPIFPGTTSSSAPVSVPGRLTGVRPRAGEGPQGLGSAGGLAWGVWGREIGVPRVC